MDNFNVSYDGRLYMVDVQDTQVQIVDMNRATLYGNEIIKVEEVVVAFGETLTTALYSLGVDLEDHDVFHKAQHEGLTVVWL